MAPRRQAKQAAAESVAAVADGNVTPPKKRKTAAKPAAADEPKQTKSRSRQAKADKQENEVTGGPASPPKKSRGRQKNAASTATAVVKTDTRNKSKKQVSKEPEDAAVDNHAGEDVAEKRTRGGKTAATAKKVGTTTAAKSKAKAPAARKQKTRATDEEGAGDSGKNVAGASPAKRTTRRMKAIEEADALAKLPAKASNRKRKNVEDTDEAIPEAQTTKEEEEEEDEVKVTSKKPRGRAKKMESDDAPVTTSRGRAKKNSKEVAKPSSEETEIKKQNGKEQNAAIQEDNSEAKNVKITKKGNAKKAAPKGKLNAAAGKADETQEEEAAPPEVDVKENGETHVVELKQKKRNAGKANAAMNGKVEAKGKQKKGQAVASVDEEEATKDVTTKDEAAENEIIEMNVAPEIDESDIKEVSLIKSNDDTILLDEKEKAEINESKADSTKNDSETSIKETERSGTFLCF